MRPITVSKEIYYIVERDLLQCQKRPSTLYSSLQDLYTVKDLQCQMRPITVSKEIYYIVERDLLQCQKRPYSTVLSTVFPNMCAYNLPKVIQCRFSLPTHTLATP
jgi:hypothetical protein